MLLQVRSRKYTLTMDLKYRINLIHSDSGIGKTTARDFIFSSRSTVTLDGEANADRFIEFFSAADVTTKSMRISRILLSEAKLIILDEIEQLSNWSDIDVEDYNRLSKNQLSDADIACLEKYGYGYSKGECRLWEQQLNARNVRKQFENTEFESLIYFHVK